MVQILQLYDAPSAIFVRNDMRAIGAIREAQEFQYRIQFDLSVIGFDNIQFVSATLPALNTIEQPIQKIANTAISLFLEKLQSIAQASFEGKRIVFNTSLVVRDSCRKLAYWRMSLVI